MNAFSRAALAALLAAAPFAHAVTFTVNSTLDQPDDLTIPGTCHTAKVYTDTTPNLAGVCRIFSAAFAPKSSHFYTPDAAECDTVKKNPDWTFEAVVFCMTPADANGGCASGTQPVYRVYDNGQGAAPNHRYTTSLTVRAQMLAAGWVPEGYGKDGVIMCAPV